MLRWLILVVALGVGTTTADAQVFKPKAKKAPAAEKAPKKAPAEPKAAKRDAPTKKRVTTKAKKSTAADRARPNDLTPESEPKGADKDYVRIWDDETVE